MLRARRSTSLWLTALVTAALVVTGISAPVSAGAVDTATTMSGTVLDDRGHAVDSAAIYLSGPTFGYGRTNSTGTYSIGGLVPGKYTISIQPASSSGLLPYAPDDQLVVSSGSNAKNFTLTTGGSITGTVTKPGGGIAGGAQVKAFDSTGRLSATAATSASDGTYALKGLSTGAYKIRTTLTSQNLALEWWDDKPDETSANPISVALGTATTGKNVALAQGSLLSGKVTDYDNNPAADIRVSLQVLLPAGYYGNASSTLTDAAGDYSFPALTTGTYEVHFERAWNAAANVLPEWWNNSVDQDGATAIHVVTGTPVPNIDAKLARGSSISGTLTKPSGTGMSFDSVEVQTPDGGFVDSVTADPTTGAYSVKGLPAGTYFVRFSTWTSGLASQWYKASSLRSTATPIVLASASDRSDIDATLVAGGSISGTITAPGGASPASGSVDAYDVDGQFVASGYYYTTGTSGTYTISGLPTGSYRLTVRPDRYSIASMTPDFAPGWYIGASSLATATQVPVIAGATKTVDNYVLTAGAHVSGTVVGPSGEPISNAYVSIEGTGQPPFSDGSSTDDSGHFSVVGLSAGTYSLTVQAPWQGPYLDAPDPISVTVTTGQNSASTVIRLARTGGTKEPDPTPTTTPTTTPPPHTDDPTPAGPTPADPTPAPVVPGTLLSAAPIIAGTVAVGSTVQANPGTWGPSPVALTYQWSRNGASVAGATSAVYPVTAADAATTLTVAVTGTKPGFTTATRVSAPLSVPNIVVTSTPTIKGSVTVGTVLTAKVSIKKVKGAKVTYQWFVNGKKIKGATKAKYKLTKKELGKKVTVVVKSSKKGYTTVKVTSKPTKKVRKK